MATIEELTETIVKFRDERDWAQFHNAKDLSLALFIANKYNFDVAQIILDKIEKNAQKYPVEKAKGSAKKYNEL